MRKRMFTKVVPAAAALTLMWSAAQGAVIEVGTASGDPGETVEIEVSLDTEGGEVAGTQNDISFGSGVRVAARPNGRPDCTVNPAINKGGTSFAFQPAGCSGAACTGIRALVLALDNVDPIPDGSVLYTCKVVIASDAPPQTTAPLTCSGAGASDSGGSPVATRCTNGAVNIEGEGPPRVTIEIGSATGAPGSTVQISVSLDTKNLAEIAGTQNDISFQPGARIAARPNGRPDCTVNPAINKGGTSFAFQPAGCSGDACTGIRALVLALDNVDPIPSGSVLYTCNVQIASNATGTLPLTCSNAGGSDPSGTPVEVACTNGAVTVATQPTNTPVPTFTNTPAAPPPTATSTRAPTNTQVPVATPTRTNTPRPTRPPDGRDDEDDGCQISAPRRSGNFWLLLIPVAGLLWFRRRSR